VKVRHNSADEVVVWFQQGERVWFRPTYSAVLLIAVGLTVCSCGTLSSSAKPPTRSDLLTLADVVQALPPSTGDSSAAWSSVSDRYLSTCLGSGQSDAESSVTVSYLNAGSSSIVHERLSTIPAGTSADFISTEGHYIARCFDAPQGGFVADKTTTVSAPACRYQCTEQEVTATGVPNLAERVIVEAQGTTGLVLAIQQPPAASDGLQGLLASAQAKVWPANP
jgi:hypothetical protein